MTLPSDAKRNNKSWFPFGDFRKPEQRKYNQDDTLKLESKMLFVAQNAKHTLKVVPWGSLRRLRNLDSEENLI